MAKDRWHAFALTLKGIIRIFIKSAGRRNVGRRDAMFWSVTRPSLRLGGAGSAAVVETLTGDP